jgi:hypothetical protein
VGPDVPDVGGISIGYGEYSMETGETGSFVFGGIHILGIGVEAGFGWSGEPFEPSAY